MKTQLVFHFIALLSCTLLLLWAGCGGDEDDIGGAADDRGSAKEVEV